MKRMMIALMAVALLAAPAFAEVKVAYVDLQKALNMSQAGASAKEEISAQVKEYEAEFKNKQDQLMQMKNELEKQGALLSEAARSEKEREYQQQLKDLQRFQKDVQEELQQKDSAHTKRILNELYEILQQLGEEGGYTLILEKNEGAVIYADASIDLTDALIEAYDAQ